MVLTSLPPKVVKQLLSVESDLLLSTEVNARELAPLSLSAVKVGNVHTLLTQGYSPKEQEKLRALLHLRGFFVYGQSPLDNKWIRWLMKKLSFDGPIIWKMDKTLKLQVLETPAAMLAVLKELHDGFGHRALPTVYHHFKLRYWIPVVAKVIRHYIEGCSAYQRLAAISKKKMCVLASRCTRRNRR